MEQHIQKQIDDIVTHVVCAVPTRAIYLFGSYAKGTQHADSDLDLYILTDDAKRPMEYLRDINRTIRPVRRMPVDILVMPYRMFQERAMLVPTLEHTVFKEGVCLYGQ